MGEPKKTGLQINYIR